MKIDKKDIHLVLSKIIELRDSQKENPNDMYVLSIIEFEPNTHNIFYKLVDYGVACWVIKGQSIDNFNYGRLREFAMKYLSQDMKKFMMENFNQKDNYIDFESIATKSILKNEYYFLGWYGPKPQLGFTNYARFLFEEKETTCNAVQLPPGTNFSSPPPEFPANRFINEGDIALPPGVSFRKNL